MGKNSIVSFFSAKSALLSLLVVLISASSVFAIPLNFSVSDPIGDNGGAIDIVEFNFTIENTTGAYTAEYVATDTAPFTGFFTFIYNLQNLNTGQDFRAAPVFDLGTATSSSYQVTGTNSLFLGWNEDDEIAYYMQGSFFNGIYAPHPQIDYLGIFAEGSTLSATLRAQTAPVPEPSTMLLLGSGLVGLAVYRRKKE